MVCIYIRFYHDYSFRFKICSLTEHVQIMLTITKSGAVPVTVSRMLKRQLRIHVVGIEKEMNFLDLFKEIGYILPFDVKVIWNELFIDVNV